MNDNLEIRENLPGDAAGIDELYVTAFPDEDLFPLVRPLLDLGQSVISLLGLRENSIAGHIIFTLCRVEGGEDTVALLAPLAVAPALHNQGIGSALVQTGFNHLEQISIDHVFVLGDPAYYGRFGFKTEDKVATPYPLPIEWRGAWQSMHLRDGGATPEGKLLVPEPWRDIALWTS